MFPEQLLLVVAEAVTTLIILRHLRGGEAAVRRTVRDRLGEREPPRAELPGKVGGAEALRHGHRWGAARSRLRPDDHDAIRCLGAVDRGRRCALQDLDALDVRRIQLGNAVDAAILIRRVLRPAAW